MGYFAPLGVDGLECVEEDGIKNGDTLWEMITYRLREIVGWCVELGTADSLIPNRRVDLYHCLDSRVNISDLISWLLMK
jgi:hypothetical protein